jgi:UDP-N-acetylglucosamine--N-acetylmuramyl-(pentapeptide) pyrophosphoryl-undecaprenol N-acetylglucosamine transferase
MNKLNQNNIFIAGGGTGGHLFPALTIGNYLEKEGLNIIYIGSKHGIERKYFEDNNMKAELLDIKGIQRDLSLKSIMKNCYFPIRFIKSYIASRKLIKKFNPKIIIGTGGYSSGLPLLAGIHMKIPTMIQDQNSIPGLITKKLYKKVSLICLAYKTAQKYIKTNNTVLTGNPIRENLKKIDQIKAKEKLGLDHNKKTIFVLGGSQGSQIINKHIYKNIKYYDNQEFQLFLQCGENNYAFIPKEIHKSKNIIIKKFVNDMSIIYSAADLVISRAGALAISELCYMGKAMILIPFKFAADNHQELNATEIKHNNACIKINEDDLKTGLLEKKIKKIFNDSKRINELENNSFKIAKSNATKDIIQNIIKVINA